jgi:hypothetical protein
VHPRYRSPGTIERLLHEIDFNLEVAGHSDYNQIGCPFEVSQFDRALADGTYAVFHAEVRAKLREAYMWAKRATTFIATMLTDPYEGRLQEARVAVVRAKEPFEAAKACLPCES